MNDRSRRFLAVLRDGDAVARRALLQEMPASPMRDTAAFMLESDDRVAQVMALNVLITAYGFGQAAALAADLARAAWVFAHDVYTRQGPGGPLQLFTVSAIPSSGLHASNLVGQFAETVDFADEVIRELESLGDDANLPDILAHRIEALIGLDRIDEAAELITYAERGSRRSAHLARLKEKVEDARRPPSDMPAPGSVAKPPSPEAFDVLRRGLDEGRRVLTKSGGEMNEWKAHEIQERIGRLFLDDGTGRDPARLAEALQELVPSEAWARTNGLSDLQNDFLWEIYLCHSRLSSWADAAAALQELRRNVEKRRAGIADANQRAGVGLVHPHVYPALCQMLARAGQTDELLGAIEGAKGRAVADLMAQRAGQVIDEAAFSEPATHMGELMRKHQAHYLSFLVDDENTLAVLVAKDGSLHASPPIPLGKEQIRRACRHVDPEAWGRADLADPAGPPVQTISEVLAPLVAWLQPHAARGLLAEGDHVCYSPDEHLHQIPLAYVNFMGFPLVRRFSISRTHGARALSLLLNRPAVRPGAFVNVVVPGRRDDQEMVRQLGAAGAWLMEHLPGDTIRGTQATAEAVRQANLTRRVVHFATHGVFPVDEGRLSRNPFQHSGLALAGGDGLPDTVRLAQGQEQEKLLTPARVLEARLDLTDGHVTLQACVTGLAREGIGGDALGLDWAFVQLGAASLLTSHWNVSARLSAEFLVRFYRLWLHEKRSRATAWRGTLLSMMDERGELAHPFAWAPFSLSGDWR